MGHESAPNIRTFSSFKEFYPYYLDEHRNTTCRRLHLCGSLLVLAVIATAVVTGHYQLLWCIPLIGYGFAWIGHFFFEHNKPATFKHPVYSFIGDWVMAKDMLTGRIPL
ncbi:MAG: DUF962 domain-containing protein [Spongiibacter sp.]|nr:DUF962 domain-containing protein [Spongiibacter sp.]